MPTTSRYCPIFHSARNWPRPNAWPHFVLVAVVWAVLGLGAPRLSYCQEREGKSQTPSQDPTPFESTLAQVPDLKTELLIFNDLEIVLSDVQSLLNDVGVPQFVSWVNPMLKVDPESGLDPKAGVVRSGDLGEVPVFMVMGVSDRKKLAKRLGLTKKKRPLKDNTIFEIENTEGLSTDLLDIFATDGYLSGRQWIQFDVDSVRESREFMETFTAAPRFVDSLHRDVRGLLSNSGLSAATPADSLFDSYFDSGWIAPTSGFYAELTDNEKSTFSKLEALPNDRFFAGLKYKDHVLECRAFMQLKNGNELGALFDLSKAEDEWNPDLGFDKEELLLATSFQMDAFRSSALPRALPRFAMMAGARSQGLGFLNGNMLGSLTDLIGDSWNDLSVARVGIYHPAKDQEAKGQFCVIGIVDTDSPETVVEELNRISLMTSLGLDSENGQAHNSEIDRLVKQLQSTDLNLAARAETRLALGRKIAEERLQPLADSASPEIVARVKRVLKKIKNRRLADTSGLSVEDPLFWVTLNPVLTFVQSIDETAQRRDHMIRIEPDPGKTEEEVLKATEMMKYFFGNEWDRISVVQLPGHFVFMVGSDRARLNQIVRDVQLKTSKLRSEFNDIGIGKKVGPFQVFADLEQLKMVVDDTMGNPKRNNFSIVSPDEVKRVDPGIFWAGGNVFEDHLEVWAFIPASQIIPFFGG